MITFCGIHVTREFGAPNIRDIAVQAMRIPRFCGSGKVFWPVGMHLLLVADLLPQELEHHGLLHDAPEVCVSDVPRPMKTDAAREVEDAVLARIYAAHGLALPTKDEHAAVKVADLRSVNVEGVMECGPRSFRHIQQGRDERDMTAYDRARMYLDQFNPLDALDPEGRWVLELEGRLHESITRVHRKLSANKSLGYAVPVGMDL